MVSVQKKLRRFAGRAARKAKRELRVSRGEVGITIVIPMYNSLPYIEKTIASILEQDYDRRDFDVLVVDDGSTDGGGAYVDSIASQYPDFLRVIHVANSGSPSRPRNIGIENAKGKYLFFCDADDYFGPQALRKMIAHAERWKSDVMLVKHVSENGRPVAKAPFRNGNIPKADIYASTVFESLSPCKLFRTDFLRSADLKFDTQFRLREDDLFVTEALLRASVVSVAADYPYYHVVQRDDEANITCNENLDFQRDFELFCRLMKTIDEYADTEKTKTAKAIRARNFRFAWMACAKAIAICPDVEQQKEWFNLLKAESDCYYGEPWTRNLPSAMQLLLLAMHEESLAYFAQLADSVQVRQDGGFLKCNVLVDDVSEDDGRLFWTPAIANRKYRLEVSPEKVFLGDDEGAWLDSALLLGSAGERMRQNPLYAFEDFMGRYADLLAIAERMPSISCRCYGAILKNVGERLKSNMLFPFHLEGKERDSAERRLWDLLGKIPAQAYTSADWLDKYHKVFLLREAGLINEGRAPLFFSDETRVFLKDGGILGTAAAKVVVSKCFWNDESLFLGGRIVCPGFLLADALEAQVVIDGNTQGLRLLESSYSRHDSKSLTSRAFDFYFNLPSADISKSISVSFRLMPRGQQPLDMVIEKLLRRHNFAVAKKSIACSGGTLEFEDRAILVNPSSSARAAYRLGGKAIVADSEFRNELIQAMKEFEGGPLWVYSDSPFYLSEGNGLQQMLHDDQQHDDVKRIYISVDPDSTIKQNPFLEGRCLRTGSMRHAAACMAAERILTSFIDQESFQPLSQDQYDKVGDFLNPRQTVVYLQHGVLHADLILYIPYDRRAIDFAVVSTTLEEETMPAKYNYPQRSLISCGMPRFDRLAPGKQEKRILFAPSWRKYLTPIDCSGKEPEKWGDSQFTSSALFKGIREFIDLLKEKDILEKYGYALDIKLHPNFRHYEHLLEVDDERINLKRGEVKEDSYEIVISDFSSYVYDFLYVGAQLVYFMPDMLEFKAGLNHYRKINVPFDDGFGPLCLTAEEVCGWICRMADPSPEDEAAINRYRRKAQQLFLHTDGRNSDRLYEWLSDTSSNNASVLRAEIGDNG